MSYLKQIEATSPRVAPRRCLLVAAGISWGCFPWLTRRAELPPGLLRPVLVRGPPCPCGEGLRGAHVLQQNEVMGKTKLYLLEECDKAKDSGREALAGVSCYMQPRSRSLGKA